MALVKTVKIGVLTYGCSVNKSDSELMATLLADAGFELVLESEEPGIILVNTCIVKGPTESRIIRKLQDLEKAGKRVIVAGCMPKAYPKLLTRFKGFAVLGVNCFDVVEVVKGYLEEGNSKKVRDSGEKVLPKKIKFNKYIDIVPISEGCLGACTYCATRFARGGLRSYSPEAIVSEITESVKGGAKEIWLTSQDNGCYGFDIGTDITRLLRAIIEIPGEFKVRIGMMNPQHIKGYLNDLIEIYKSEKVFKFAHIPVQSGSDKILRDMKRGYSVKDYAGIVSRLKSAVELTVSTDIIVGYPTETDRDFKDTIKLLKKNPPDFLNLSRYWPRKGTVAGEMGQLPRDIVAARSKKVTELYSKQFKKRNKSLMKKIISVTFTEKKGAYSVGRSPLYRPVLVAAEGLLGKTCKVKVIGARRSELIGEIAS